MSSSKSLEVFDELVELIECRCFEKEKGSAIKSRECRRLARLLARGRKRGGCKWGSSLMNCSEPIVLFPIRLNHSSEISKGLAETLKSSVIGLVIFPFL